MNVKIYNQEGKEVGEMELAKIFDVRLNRDLLHQVVTSEEANARISYADARDRAEVRGGGKKPWRQKGTGRARHGSIRSPIWKGGGVTHGPTNARNFAKKINKKMASLALRMAIANKAKDGELVVFEDLKISNGRTKQAANVVANLAKQKDLAAISRKSAVVLLPNGAMQEARAFRNLKNVEVEEAAKVTARNVLKSTFLLMPKESMGVLESRLSKK